MMIRLKPEPTDGQAHVHIMTQACMYACTYHDHDMVMKQMLI